MKWKGMKKKWNKNELVKVKEIYVNMFWFDEYYKFREFCRIFFLSLV